MAHPGGDDLLDANGFLRLLPAAAWDSMGWTAMRLWCHFQARYGLPTTETVQALREMIGDRRAIEIGAGCGDLAHHLGIPATDSHLQVQPDVAAYYTAMRQPVIRYGSNVEKLDAAAAIERYDPEVVIASWVTEWLDPDKPVPPQGGNMYGIKEDLIVGSGRVYILIGNEKTHGEKRIMDIPHEMLILPFLRSRSAYPHLDRIWIWNGI